MNVDSKYAISFHKLTIYVLIFDAQYIISSLTEQCPKILEGFLVGYKAEKCHFLGEFSRISGFKRSLAVCTTVVQLGILRLIY